MSIAGIDFDAIWDKFDDFSGKVSDFIKTHAQKINFIAVGILSLIGLGATPWAFLAGFVISLVLSTADIAIGDKISNFLSRFLPENGTQKTTLIAALGMIAQGIFPPLFGFGLGIFSGRKFAEISTNIFTQFRLA